MESNAQSVWCEDSSGTYREASLKDEHDVVLNPVVSNKEAIEQFSQLSNQFIDSYQQLESQITDLNEQLAAQTAAKELKAQENERLARRLETIVSTLPNGVIVIDGHGVVSEANAVAGNMLKYSGDLVGASWIEIISQAFAPRSDDGHEISLIDGRRIKVETQAIGREPGQIVTLTDLTDTRKVQEHQSREQRLSVIGKMMASLAHQIRTPLSAALLYSGQLSSPRVTKEKIVEFQRHMTQSLKQLEHHVSDMLLFASGGVAKSERFTVKELVSAINTQVLINPLVDVDIEFNQSLVDINERFLYGNLQALLGALSNIIDNAIHACKDNQSVGKITAISMDIESAANNTLCLSISDNGCGISEQQQTQIFEPFFTGKSKGTGLGLAVVKTIITNFKGDVQVSSKPDKGTCFVIHLPLIEQNAITQKHIPEAVIPMGGA